MSYSGITSYFVMPHGMELNDEFSALLSNDLLRLHSFRYSIPRSKAATMHLRLIGNFWNLIPVDEGKMRLRTSDPFLSMQKLTFLQ